MRREWGKIEGGEERFLKKNLDNLPHS